MKLKDIKLPTKEVPVSEGQSFSVRGLGFEDISFLFGEHQVAMTAMFDRYVAAEETTGKATANVPMEAIAKDLAKEAPLLVAAIIAIAADDPTSAAVILKFPFPVQIDALKKIGELTFASEGGLGKVIETVSQVMVGATALGRRVR